MIPNVRTVTRGKVVALAAAGCALAAAAAGTGPYLSSHAVPDVPLRELLATAARERQRRRLEDGTFQPPEPTWADRVVEVVVVLAVGAVVVWALVRFVRLLARLVPLLLRRGTRGEETTAYDPGEESHEDAVTQLKQRVVTELDALSADLDALPEPREAVIACYVRMERALATAGLPRQANESPMELLSRVRTDLDVPEAAVRRLTALFTEARFSAHAVTDAMRHDARRALTGVTDALAVRA